MRFLPISTQKAKTAFLQAKQSLSPRTLEQYTRALTYLQKECSWLPKKPSPIRCALARPPTIWVRASLWNVWAIFFRWCSREYRTPNPMDLVEKPKLPDVQMRALEPEELAKVIAGAGNLKDRAVVALGIDCGLRASEFGRLRIADIGTDTLRVWGKGNRQAYVPISPEMHALLRLIIGQDGHNGPDSPIFTGEQGEALSRFAVYRIVRRCMERAGVPGPKRGPHCLRHSLGKNFSAAGGNVFILMRIMRHRNITTTQKYVNLAMKEVIEQHNQYSPLRQAIYGAQGVLIKSETGVTIETESRQSN